MDMCGICVMCWICVGNVWCEIRQQSSEEPCDETSFGKKMVCFGACRKKTWLLAVACKRQKADTPKGSN